MMMMMMRVMVMATVMTVTGTDGADFCTHVLRARWLILCVLPVCDMDDDADDDDYDDDD